MDSSAAEIDGPDEGENVISTAQSFPICFFPFFWTFRKAHNPKPGEGKLCCFSKFSLVFLHSKLVSFLRQEAKRVSL